MYGLFGGGAVHDFMHDFYGGMGRAVHICTSYKAISVKVLNNELQTFSPQHTCGCPGGGLYKKLNCIVL